MLHHYYVEWKTYLHVKVLDSTIEIRLFLIFWFYEGSRIAEGAKIFTT